MNAPLLLGIDLGTTSCDAGVYSATGERLGSASKQYPQARIGSHQVEQHAQDWWRVASICARSAISESGLSGKNVVAVAVSSQGSSVVPVGDDGSVLRPAMTWQDTRSVEELKALETALGAEQWFLITGLRPAASHSLPKILWLRGNEPELYERTARFLLPHDYVVYRLTGRYATDHSLAAGTLAHDVSKLDWSEAVLSAAGVGQERFAELGSAGTAVGPIVRESAETLGISREAVAARGGQDLKCSMLGVGARLGDMVISLTTSTAVSCVVDAPVLDGCRRLACSPFLSSGRWVLSGYLPSSGSTLKWFRDTLFPGVYAVLDAMAEPAFEETRDLFFYPHLAGAGSPVWQDDAAGALYGIRLSTSGGAISRAVLEGIAYQVRANLDVMAENGAAPERVLVYGGGTRSRVWTQILADVLGREIVSSGNIGTGTSGAAALAAAGAGIASSVEEAAVLQSDQTVIPPDPERAREYRERYSRYKDIEDRLIGDGRCGGET